MGFIDALGDFDAWQAFWAVMILIPIVDKEIVAIIPGLRDAVPQVRPLYLTKLSWSGRFRLAILVFVPYLDGEVLELAGIDYVTLVED